MEPESTQFARLTGDMKANLAVLVETGICKVNATASLVCMPTTADYSARTKSTKGGISPLNPLPQSARDIYLKQHGSSSKETTDKFFEDDWYFIELHQSILQESTQQNR